ncbi:ATP-grasp domain-containing protein [Enterococcus cecorum]|nr:ATP-grasp domain-containing protein [Enterococcus cecorum]MCJ0557991.1 ATP-grasp domain-containing protein [Enterococcus cecorum]MCJ0562781.1 ATP-grasp domain-containing protein [Enterococcus cecorum]
MKEYVELKTFNGRHNEYRVFYANGKAISIAESVANDEFTTQPPRDLVEKYQHLPSPFYTVDYAELADGSWIVIEAGDGQVSGLSDHQDRVAFMGMLSEAMKG